MDDGTCREVVEPRIGEGGQGMKIYNTKGELLLDAFGKTLREVNLVGYNLASANFREAKLRNVNFAHANLKYADFEGADLEGANMRRANLRCANMAYADCESINLYSANLFGADLTYADFTSANLTYADLGLADLTDVDLCHTALTGTYLKGAKGIVRIEFYGHEIVVQSNGMVRIGCQYLPISEFLAADHKAAVKMGMLDEKGLEDVYKDLLFSAYSALQFKKGE